MEETIAESTKIAEAGHTIPAIDMESKAPSSDTFVNKLSKAFTIGNTKFDENLTIYGEKNN